MQSVVLCVNLATTVPSEEQNRASPPEKFPFCHIKKLSSSNENVVVISPTTELIAKVSDVNPVFVETCSLSLKS